jgi:hypothetical protein
VPVAGVVAADAWDELFCPAEDVLPESSAPAAFSLDLSDEASFGVAACDD